jgi:hypothetical protein
MRAGWNPTRRNRNQGQPWAGLGRSNPGPLVWHDNPWDRLGPHTTVIRKVQGRKRTFWIAPTLPDHFHACSVGDVVSVLEQLPGADIFGLDRFWLRQSSRREERGHPVWGRMLYWVVPGPGEGGACVVLEAQPRSLTVRWGRHLAPEDLLELERLRLDGHRVEQTRRGHLVHCTPETIRNTQLLRTLPHEIGHFVDRKRYDETPEVYWRKSELEKESFAHRYAERFRERLVSSLSASH